MVINGLQKTTLLDFPGHVAATIFLGGCNLRCPFCHNMNLVVGDLGESITVEEFISFLKKRKGILDGVCITGGEPTLYSDLPDLMIKIKQLGYLVKLDTNGTNAIMLRKLVTEKLVDYVAMDIKSGLSNYEEVCGIEKASKSDKSNNIVNNIRESIDFLLTNTVDYEFRTTLVSEYHNKDIIMEIGDMIKGAEKYYLQSFKDSDFVPDHFLNAPEKEELLEYCKILSQYVKTVEIRGVE